MWDDFKKFAVRGNVIDLAVGIIIGAAFTGVVNSLVEDIIMPPIGYVVGNVDFSELFVVLKNGTNTQADGPPYTTVAMAKADGAVVMAYRQFINRIISFLIVAWTVFLLVRFVQRVVREENSAAPETAKMKDCPGCLMSIPAQAAKCGRCTAELGSGVI